VALAQVRKERHQAWGFVLGIVGYETHNIREGVHQSRVELSDDEFLSSRINVRREDFGIGCTGASSQRSSLGTSRPFELQLLTTGIHVIMYLVLICIGSFCQQVSLAYLLTGLLRGAVQMLRCKAAGS
jgi:hypothetical protein